MLLDTSACIDIMRRQRGGIAAMLGRFADTVPVLSTIVLAELEYGRAQSRNPEETSRHINEFAARCEVRDFDSAAARQYADLRAYLRAKGTEIGPMDLLIAAHALSLQLPVLTSNVREFERVPGLEVLSIPAA